MPQYDESFFLDDNINQRRNKRSYRVYKKGIYPTENIKVISNGFNGTYAAKLNNLQKCKKDFGSIANLGDVPPPEKLYPKAVNKSFPSLLDGDYVDKYILTRSTSTLKNYSNNCCGGGKSLEDLLSKKGYSKNSLGFLSTKVRSKESQINYYAVNTENVAPVVAKSKRLYESNRKHRDKSEARTKKTLESGSYRRLDTSEDNEDSGFIDDTNGILVQVIFYRLTNPITGLICFFNLFQVRQVFLLPSIKYHYPNTVCMYKRINYILSYRK